jgi:hypothetical protein
LRVAGGDAGQIFTREAVEIVAERSGGVPRTVNVICDNALVGGFAAGAKPVDARIVRDVCEEFDLASAPPTNGGHGATEPVVTTAAKAVAPEAKGPMFGAVSRRRRFPSSDWNGAMSRIGDALKRAGTEEGDGFATLADDGVDLFEPTTDSSAGHRAHRGRDRIAGDRRGSSRPLRALRRRCRREDGGSLQRNPVAREQYRRLAATLHHVQAERGLKAILVGSAWPRRARPSPQSTSR